ncbi:kelch-like protein 24 [Glandiceps talaboti]
MENEKTRNSYAWKLLAKLHDQRNDGNLSDVTVNVQGSTFVAHRAILCACSPYFEASFKSGMAESKKFVHDLEFIIPNAFERILNYMYTGSIILTENDVEDIMQGADYLAMEEVRELCTSFFMKVKIKVGNCFDLRQIADRYDIKPLKTKMSVYIQSNFHDIIKSERYLTLGVEDFVKFLQNQDNIVEIVKNGEIVVGEESLLDVIIKWVGYGEDRIHHIVAVLADCVRLEVIQTDILERFLDTTKSLVRNSTILENVELLIRQVVERRSNDTDGLYKVRPPRRGELIDILAVCEATNTQRQSHSTYAYVFAEGRWVQLSCLPEFVFGAAAVNYNGKIYVCGGLSKQGHRGNSTLRDALYCYDPMINHWQKLSPMLKAVQRHGITMCCGHLFIIGGLEEHYITSVVQCYSIDENVWVNKCSMPATGCDVLTFSCDPYIFAMIGWSSNPGLSSSSVPFYRYNCEIDVWEELAPPPISRNIMSQISVLKTSDDDVTLTNFRRNEICYNAKTNTWVKSCDENCRFNIWVTMKSCFVVNNPPRVIALSTRGTLYIWDSKTCELLQTIPSSEQRRNEVVTISPCQFSCVLKMPYQFL